MLVAAAGGGGAEVPEPLLLHLGEDVGREVREAEGQAGAADRGSVGGGQAGEPGFGVEGGAGGEVEGVHCVEHVAAVVVDGLAGCQEVEARLLLLLLRRGGDLVVRACYFDFVEGCGGTLEDGLEAFARGGWF